jgi:integrase
MRKDHRVFSNDEMRKIAEFFTSHRNKSEWWNPAFMVGLVTFGAGLRAGEARTLRLDDCKLAPVPSVFVKSNKGGGSEREVAILPEFRAYFKERIEFMRFHQQQDARIEHLFPAGWVGAGALRSVKLQGPPISKDRATKWWVKVRLRLGIPHLNSRTARRSWATYLIRMKWKNPQGEYEGLSPYDIARQMGHKGLDLISGFYDNSPAHMRFPGDRELDWPKVLREFTPDFGPSTKRYYRLAKRRRSHTEEEARRRRIQQSFEDYVKLVREGSESTIN